MWQEIRSLIVIIHTGNGVNYNIKYNKHLKAEALITLLQTHLITHNEYAQLMLSSHCPACYIGDNYYVYDYGCPLCPIDWSYIGDHKPDLFSKCENELSRYMVFNRVMGRCYNYENFLLNYTSIISCLDDIITKTKWQGVHYG